MKLERNILYEKMIVSEKGACLTANVSVRFYWSDMIQYELQTMNL